mmetsp:Transcript_32888/g.50286  ORF Transcript_32888/g.50286 Transcript_32888/m.50286 type:complete len:95 (-) Transcript_32888:11-295(-)
MEIFLTKLQSIRLIFEREVSEINKNVIQKPVLSEEVLRQLNNMYNLGVKESDFKMEASMDTVGEHFVTAAFYSPDFDREFKFLVKLEIREMKKN